jgi:hypothetical protein
MGVEFGHTASLTSPRGPSAGSKPSRYWAEPIVLNAGTRCGTPLASIRNLIAGSRSCSDLKGLCLHTGDMALRYDLKHHEVMQ